MNKTERRALSRDILNLLRDGAGRPLKPKEIARTLNVPTRDYRDLKGILGELVAAGDLYRVKRGRYAPPGKINLVVGRFAVGRHGGGTVTGDPPGSESIYVAARDVASALHGDRVACRTSASRSGPLPEGEIIRVVERARQEIVGTYRSRRHLTMVEPEDDKILREILISEGGDGGAKDGHLVVVRIVDWGDRRRMMVGEVTEILGSPGDPGLDVLIVMKDYDLPRRFPDEVEAAADALPTSPDPAEIARRTDFRDRIAFTIDPADAKDHDDALSVRPLDGGLLEIGVHIADVSHYVEPRSVIDREAYLRGTSVYLVDRVVPMLPEALSNRLCSLVPDTDRLAYSVVFRMEAASARVRSVRFVPSVIRSRRRYAYEEVQSLLEGGKPEDGDREYLDPVKDLAAISARLIARREQRGSLDFDITASRVILDENGLPVDIRRDERLEAHRLVESFMLLANEAVARRLKSLDWPALYRIHEAPNPLAAQELQQTLARLGYRLPIRKSEALTPRMLQKLLKDAADSPEAELINMLILRSLKRALYDPNPTGHFGLATRDYAHFTSPIRRYPDLVVHRILKAAGNRGKPPVEDGAEMLRIAEHCSERERIAEEAERASVELKKVQFMSERIGERYHGRIVGVTPFGFFVELDTYHVSGLVHVNRLEDDYYHFNPENLTLLGERTGRVFKLGQPVEVEVSRADIARRQIDFELLGMG